MMARRKRVRDESDGSPSPRGFGWADDIIAPPQEFDVLAVLDQEARINEALEGRHLTSANFVEAYTEALEAHRRNAAKRPPGEARMTDLLEAVALFGAQATLRARQVSRDRFVATFTAPDQPGVLARAATALAEAGGNIEGANMSVVAHQLLVAFLLSGPEPESETELQEALADALGGVGNITPAVTSITAHDPEWPRPGSSFWHLTARLSHGDDLFGPVIEEVANAELPILALSSWIEEASTANGKRVQVVDLNLAIKATAATDGAAIMGKLETKIKDRLRAAQIGFVPVDWPTKAPALGEAVSAEHGDLALTVLGHARPGFVHSVFQSTRSAFDDPPALRGSTMAILEGVTVLTLVLQRPERGLGPAALEEQVLKRIAADLEGAGHHGPAVRLNVLDSTKPELPASREQPTHELRIQVKEQPWVIANVASVLAARNVNITWFASYVLEPMVGQEWPRCALEMHLNVMYRGSLLQIDRDLRTLAEAQGWAHVSLRPWSLGVVV
jgi:glycine cleavage system regulatory protein